MQNGEETLAHPEEALRPLSPSRPRPQHGKVEECAGLQAPVPQVLLARQLNKDDRQENKGNQDQGQ